MDDILWICCRCSEAVQNTFTITPKCINRGCEHVFCVYCTAETRRVVQGDITTDPLGQPGFWGSYINSQGQNAALPREAPAPPAMEPHQDLAAFPPLEMPMDVPFASFHASSLDISAGVAPQSLTNDTLSWPSDSLALAAQPGHLLASPPLHFPHIAAASDSYNLQSTSVPIFNEAAYINGPASAALSTIGQPTSYGAVADRHITALQQSKEHSPNFSFTPQPGQIQGMHTSDSDSSSTENDVSGRQKTPRERRFRCPFVYHDAMKYRGCLKRGFTRIGDLKQHLRRRHMKPLFCGLCKKKFKSDAERKAHLGSVKPCRARMGSEPEGISESQRESMSRYPKDRNDGVAQWNMIWDIIFPNRVEMKPYSPFMDERRPDEIASLVAFFQSKARQILGTNSSTRDSVDQIIYGALIVIGEWESANGIVTSDAPINILGPNIRQALSCQQKRPSGVASSDDRIFAPVDLHTAPE